MSCLSTIKQLPIKKCDAVSHDDKVIYTKYSKHYVAHRIDCVCRKWFKSWVFPFTFQAYTLPHTLNSMCVSLFKFHI